MPINGVDIDQYILLIFYPSIVFFTIGYITKKRNIKRSITYLVQAIVCFVFSIAYYLFIPQDGAFGLALILGLFGILLLIQDLWPYITGAVRKAGYGDKWPL